MAMHSLGETRSAHRHDHLLQTPDTFVRAAFPGLTKGTAIVHMAEAGGAAFTQYTVEFEAGGTLAATDQQRFLYVLEGAVTIHENKMTAGGYAYTPPGEGRSANAIEPCRVAVIEKGFSAANGLGSPRAFTGYERDADAQPLAGDPDLTVRTLFPEGNEYDFAVNTMTYQPGASLSMVELHVMEHGLLMLDGEGIYRLGDCWYPVSAGDFIWMAPYCPQWFGALGKTPAKYLIYKDWNRRP